MSSAAQGGLWVVKASTPNTGGFGEAVAGAGDYIYVIRGYSTGVCQFWKYSPAGNSWTTLLEWSPDSPVPRPKSGTSLAWDHGNYIYALLGSAYADSDRRYFHRYSITSNSWEGLTSTPHAQGAGDALAWSGYDSSFYAMIGSNVHGTGLAQYSPSANTWQMLPFNPTWSVTDDGASLVWTGGEYLYALRGEWEETTPHNDFARYHIPTRTWETKAAIPVGNGVGDGASLLWVGEYPDYIFALGGNDVLENPGYGFYRYSISSDSWTSLEQIPYPVGYYVGSRLGFAGGQVYYWQGAPSTWSGGGTKFCMFQFSTTLTTTITTTITTTTTTTSSTLTSHISTSIFASQRSTTTTTVTATMPTYTQTTTSTLFSGSISTTYTMTTTLFSTSTILSTTILGTSGTSTSATTELSKTGTTTLSETITSITTSGNTVYVNITVRHTFIEQFLEKIVSTVLQWFSELSRIFQNLFVTATVKETVVKIELLSADRGTCRIELNASPKPGYVGKPVNISGVMYGSWHCVRDGMVVGKPVTITADWGFSTIAVTDYYGRFSVTTNCPSTAGTYPITATFYEDQDLRGNSTSILYVVTSKIPTSITISYIANREFGGYLRRADTGAYLAYRPVKLTVTYLSGTTWRTDTFDLQTRQDGYYSLEFLFYWNQATIVFEGDETYASSQATITR